MPSHVSDKTTDNPNVEVTVIETPIKSYMGEEGLKLAIMKDSRIIAENLKIIAEEHPVLTGRVDLVGSDGVSLYLIELKTVPKKHMVPMVKKQGVNQLVRYYTGMEKQKKIFNSNIPIKAVLVIGIPDPEISTPVRYMVKPDGGETQRTLTYKPSGFIKFEDKLEDKRMELMDKIVRRMKVDVRDELDRLKDNVAFIKSKISKLREEKERIEREIAEAKTHLQTIKKGRWGEKLIVLLERTSYEPVSDRCFLCGGPSELILCGKDSHSEYGLCIRCWELLVKLEEERLKASIRSTV